MHGQVDHSGNLMARGHYNWVAIPQPEMPKIEEGEQPVMPVMPEQPKITSTSKLQAQLMVTNPQQS